jgi:hypothetical protein
MVWEYFDLGFFIQVVSFFDKGRRDVRGVSKRFGEWYQKTNKTEDTNKLTLLAF